jgi:hypothetical protein
MNIRCSCWHFGVRIGTVLFSCSPTLAAKTRAAREVRSPDGKIAITIHTDAPLGYSMTVDGKPVLLRSGLGLELAGDVKLGEKPIVESEKRRSADNHWENQFGKNRDMRDHYHELSLTLKEGDCAFGVVARAYDDGVAFRMVLPKRPRMDSFVVTRDATESAIADDDQVWAGWNNPEGTSRPEDGFIGSQEGRYLPNELSGLNPERAVSRLLPPPCPAEDMCNDQRQPRRGAIRMAGTEKSTFRPLTRGGLTCWGCGGRSAG